MSGGLGPSARMWSCLLGSLGWVLSHVFPIPDAPGLPHPPLPLLTTAHRGQHPGPAHKENLVFYHSPLHPTGAWAQTREGQGQVHALGSYSEEGPSHSHFSPPMQILSTSWNEGRSLFKVTCPLRVWAHNIPALIDTSHFHFAVDPTPYAAGPG